MPTCLTHNTSSKLSVKNTTGVHTYIITYSLAHALIMTYDDSASDSDDAESQDSNHDLNTVLY